MKKKEIFTLKNLLYALAAVVAVVAICMMFVNAISYNYTALGRTYDLSFTGVEATFGKEDVLGFSFMNMLSYILVLVALIIVVLKLCGVFKSKIFDYVAFALFIVSAVFFFLTVQFVVWNDALKTFFDTVEVTFSLGAGAIVSGVMSLLAAGSVAVACTRKK